MKTLRSLLHTVAILVSGMGLAQNQDIQEQSKTNKVYEIFDVSKPASFPGGEDGLRKELASNLDYPAAALENDIGGSVLLKFVVDSKQLEVMSVHLKKCYPNQLTKHRRKNTSEHREPAPFESEDDFGLSQAALDAVKKIKTKWEPAEIKGESVDMIFRLPIKFQIF